MSVEAFFFNSSIYAKTFNLFLYLNLLFKGQILQQEFYAWKSPLEITACFA